ncbi:MAG TPA: hypothetical protein VJ981_06030 [Gammaproteobacteria bacterium]|nr:hypothetical protein [Gammaproteobacteria bacterium]
MAGNFRVKQRHLSMVSGEARESVLPADIFQLIERGKLEREGNWYRVNDLRILGNELYGLIRRIFISRNETLIQLY